VLARALGAPAYTGVLVDRPIPPCQAAAFGVELGSPVQEARRGPLNNTAAGVSRRALVAPGSSPTLTRASWQAPCANEGRVEPGLLAGVSRGPHERLVQQRALAGA